MIHARILLVLLLSILLHSSNSLVAQINIKEDIDVSRVMSVYSMKANENAYVDGWRIQVINTDDRRKMESARSKFGAMHPNLEMTWKHIQPYYQVRAGAFKTRLELEPLLQTLKEEFPRAIPVRDKIEKAELVQ